MISFSVSVCGAGPPIVWLCSFVQRQAACHAGGRPLFVCSSTRPRITELNDLIGKMSTRTRNSRFLN